MPGGRFCKVAMISLSESSSGQYSIGFSSFSLRILRDMADEVIESAPGSRGVITLLTSLCIENASTFVSSVV